MTTPWIAAFIVLWFLVLLLAFVVLGVVRRVSGVLEAAEARLGSGVSLFGGIAPGTRIPSFEVRNRSGAVVESPDLIRSGAILLFLSSDCAPCKTLLAELHERADDPTTAPIVVVLGDTEEERRVVVPPGITVFHQSDRAAATAFQSFATPHAFAVAPDNTVIDSAIPQSFADLRKLSDQLEGGDLRTADRAELAVG